jgi:hypothetical protein
MSVGMVDRFDSESDPAILRMDGRDGLRDDTEPYRIALKRSLFFERMQTCDVS